MTTTEIFIQSNRAKATEWEEERQLVGPPKNEETNPISAAPEGDIPLPGK